MTILIGVVTAAVLFGLFTAIRGGGAGCTGHCAGCTRDRACETGGGKR